jgi:hypothetical protein
MTMALSHLPSALTLQFNKLCEDDQRTDKNKQIYSIADVNVTVSVSMEIFARALPEDVVVCLGKLFVNKAAVIVYPADENVEKVVSAHFQDQKLQPFIPWPLMPLFDEVIVNGKKVVLS